MEYLGYLMTYLVAQAFLLLLMILITVLPPGVIAGLYHLLTYGEDVPKKVQTPLCWVYGFLCVWWVFFLWVGPASKDNVAQVTWERFKTTPSEFIKNQEKKEPPTITELGTEIRRYKLLSWNPPKHFYVDIQDVQTGEVISNLYVSKHCNKSNELQRMQEYNIVLRKYKTSTEPDKIQYSFTNLYYVFCG